VNTASVLALIEKTMTIANALIAAGQSAEPAIKALFGAVRGDPTALTQAEIDKTDAILDKLIADFNLEI
jgi:hypothetical protein